MMALAKVLSCATGGLDGELVEVEVDIARGMPAFAIVGLPDAAVQEAKAGPNYGTQGDWLLSLQGGAR